MKRLKRNLKQGGASRFLAPPSSLGFLSTGCEVLDLVLGRGYVLGRITNIVGDKSTGKTLLAIEACANFAHQYSQGRIWYREAESAFDEPYAEALGLPLDRVRFLPKDQVFDTVEDFFEDLESKCDYLIERHLDDADLQKTVVQMKKVQDKILKEKNSAAKQELRREWSRLDQEFQKNRPKGLYILDSLDSLSDRKELARDMDQGTFGADKAKQMSTLFRKLVRKVSHANISLIVISQVRDKIGISFGRKTTRSGGRALDFYASHVIYLSHIKTLYKTRKGLQRAIGVRIKAKCDKNKISLPFRECEFTIRFGYGVEDLLASVEWLKTARQISNKEADTILDNLDKMEEPEYKSIQKEITAKLRTAWQETEKEFLPKRRKYQ